MWNEAALDAFLSYRERIRGPEKASRDEAMDCRNDWTAETTMNHTSDQQSEPERQRHGPESGSRQDNRQPFDNSGLDDIPQPRSDDPPYRNWWAVEGGFPVRASK